MAVLTNTMMQGTAAISDEAGGGYQIEKSLRFDSADSAYLKRTPGTKGNRRIFTISFWIKHVKGGSWPSIIGADSDSNERQHFRWVDADGGLQIYFISGGNQSLYLVPTAKYRDYSGWQHWCLSVDTTQTQSNERGKFYHNGVRVTSFSSPAYPSQNLELQINNTVAHSIGRRDYDTSQYSDMYMADTYIIDGLALPPSAFGSFDSTGVWNPKAFGDFPQPNQNQDYSDSSNWSTSTGTLSNIDEAFKGNFGAWGPSLASASGALVTFTPDSDIDCNVGVDIGNWGASGYMWINKGLSDEVEQVLDGASGLAWIPSPTSRKIKNIAIQAVGSSVAITGFKVDGVELVDGQTDVITTRNNRNNNTTWSSAFAFSNGQYSDHAPAKAFNGNLSDNATSQGSNQTFTWTPAGTLAYAEKVEVYNNDNTDHTYNLNGGSNIAGQGWLTLATGSGTITTINGSDSSDYCKLAAVRVDGHILVDATVDNSFHLKFNDTSSTAALGTDSLNDNDFTVNNLSATDSSNPENIDSLVDTPTNYGEDTGVGGEVRGNYCTWNALDTSGTVTLDQGNLGGTGNNFGARGTIAPSTGKWYYETTITAIGNGGDYGIVDANKNVHTGDPGSVAHGWSVHTAGGKRTNGTNTGGYIAAYATGDVVNIAWDIDAGKIWFGKNGTWGSSGNPATGANAAFTNVSGKPAPAIGNGGSSGFEFDSNFGQRAFKYTAPSGFKALCTQNLDDTFSGGELNNPSKYFDVRTYTGDGETTQNVKGVSFQPDLVWQKIRNQAGNHALTDAVRGTAAGYLTAEDTGAQTGNDNDGVSAFLSDGFTAKGGFNSNNNSWVTWLWDAGSAVTNYGASDNGADIACAVWKNPTAGFSIVKWTSDAGNSNSFMNHGLGAQPGFVIIKNITSSSAWIVLHDSLGTDSTSIRENHLVLDTNAGYVDKGSEYFERASNTVFGLRHDIISSSSSDEMIAYCWTAIPGYSAFGSFTGNGSADGPFVYTGFQPRWIMTKNTATARQWVIWDTERSPSNFADECLFPDVNNAEATKGPNSGSDNDIDILSNGFRIRNADSAQNEDTKTILYSAFAEHPFKTARAR